MGNPRKRKCNVYLERIKTTEKYLQNVTTTCIKVWRTDPGVHLGPSQISIMEAFCKKDNA